MSSATRLLVTLLVACGVPAHAAIDTLSATQDEPRAYGYFVGDIVTRRIHIHAPDGLRLDEDSLPSAARLGQALELRSVQWQRGAVRDGAGYALTLEYQVFIAPREARVLEMPPIKLRFIAGAPRVQELRIEAWPVTVAPLVPLDASPRHGLGELRPDAAPPLIDTRPALWGLLVCGGLGALLLAYLAHVYLALPWWSRRKRPFALAWQQMRGVSAQSSSDQVRFAMQRVHEALNRTAGRVLFENGVSGFVASHPQFAPVHEDLRGFFRLSHSAFFGGGDDEAILDSDGVIELCRRCRDIERGAA